MPNYDKADLDAMLDDYESDKFDNTRPWQAQSGTNNVRILPPHASAKGKFLVKGGRHWGVAAYPVHCAVAFKQSDSCWACERAAELLASASKADKAEGKRMQVQPIWMANVVDLDHMNAGIQIAEFGRQIYRDLMKFIGDEDFGDISDLDEGYNVIIEKEGSTNTRTNYSSRCRKKSSAVPDEIRELIDDDGLHDLIAAAKLLEDDELEDLYAGQGTDEDVEDDDDDVPVKRSAPAKAKKRAPIDDDDLPFGDDDDDEEEEEEPEEEETPKRRLPARVATTGAKAGTTRDKMDAVLTRHGRSR